MDPQRKVDAIYADTGSEKKSQKTLSAATLPSLLRALTDINNTSQYDVWSLILHIRQYSSAKYTLNFLRGRYLLSTAQARVIAAELAAEQGSAGAPGGLKPGSSAWLDLRLQQHLLGLDLYQAAVADLAATVGAESPASLPQFFIEIKLGVLFLLETWLLSFPEDFIGAPQEYTPDGVETEVKDDWHHRVSVANRGPAEGGASTRAAQEEAPRQEDALDLLIEMVENAILPCPMLVLMGVGHLWMPEDATQANPFSAHAAMAGLSAFAASFPCLYRVVSAVHLDLNNQSSARMVSMEAEAAKTSVVKSNRNDGYDKSIIPLAIVICSINARSRMKRVSHSEMCAVYETQSGAAKLASSEPPPSEEDHDTDSAPGRLSDEDRGSFSSVRARRLSRRRSHDSGVLSDFLPWHESELLQLSELRMSITQILGTESMRCMRLMMEQYHPLVVTLRAAEMAAAENDDFVLPVKVFVTPIDKQVLTYMYSKTKGFSTVAASMVALKHHFDDNRESNTIGVNLQEAMRGYESGDSDDDSAHSAGKIGSILVAEDDGSMLSSSPDVHAHMSGRESAAIVVDEELGRQLHEQAKEEKKTLVRPLMLWRRRKKRKELQQKLKVWMEENNVPVGIDTCQGPVEVLKARAVRGLASSCKSSVLFLFAPSLLAYNMTLKLHYLYSSIPLLEFAVHAGFSVRSRREVPMLARFRTECDRLQDLFVDEVLSETDAMSRATIIINLIQIGEAAARMWSHHLLMLVVQALQCHAIHRLKDTWKLVENALPGSWASLQDCTGFGGSTLLNSQMEKFLNFGVSDDYRKNICVPKPENIATDKRPDGIEDLVTCIERSVAMAVIHGTLVSPPDVPLEQEKKVDTPVKGSKPLRQIKKSISWTNRKKYSDSFADDLLYLGCCYAEPSSGGSASGAASAEDATAECTLFDHDAAPAEFGLVVDTEIPRSSDALFVHENGTEGTTESDGVEESREPSSAEAIYVEGLDEDTHNEGRDAFPIEDTERRESTCSSSYTRQDSLSSGMASHGAGSGAFAAGIVRDDASADLVGLPKPTPQAGMPYVHGVMSKLIRLCELPEYMLDAEDRDNILFVPTPGVFESDQHLPMINFGKLRSIARWMLLLRCTQLTPYRYDEKAVLLDLHAMLLKPPEFKGQDAQWERSLFLEKKKV